jgi:ketosteroid isomerase-like protein
MTALHNWHELVESRDAKALNTLIADDAVLLSPVVHTPVAGKKMVTLYLSAALHIFANETFTYVRELADADNAILEFTTTVEGILVNGVDMIKWNADGQITEFKVMVRPLQAVNIIHKKMGEMIEKLKIKN